MRAAGALLAATLALAPALAKANQTFTFNSALAPGVPPVTVTVSDAAVATGSLVLSYGSAGQRCMNGLACPQTGDWADFVSLGPIPFVPQSGWGLMRLVFTNGQLVAGQIEVHDDDADLSMSCPPSDPGYWGAWLTADWGHCGHDGSGQCGVAGAFGPPVHS